MKKSEEIQRAIQHLVELNHFEKLSCVAYVAIKESGEMDIVIANHTPALMLIGALEMMKEQAKDEYNKDSMKPFEPGCGND